MKSAAGLILSLLIVIALIPNFTILCAESKSLTILVPGDYSSIQEAINNANAGDTILVGAGTYYANVVVNKSLSLVGEDKYNTIIDANHSGSVVCVVADYVTVSGFTIQNGGGIYGLGDGLSICSIGNEISDNIVVNNTYCGIRLIRTSNNVITGNYVASNYAGIELTGSDHNTIRGNNVSFNTHGGIRVSSGGNNQIWSMNADGSSQTRLTTEASDDSYPRWSPDGSRIAYTHFPPYFSYSELWVMNPDGMGKTQITVESRSYSIGGWSPDGSQIVFCSFYGPGIWVMDSDGTDQKQLTMEWGDYAPAWSPDGTKIAFSSYMAGSNDIWIMNSDGTEFVRLTKGIPGASNPSWSPDGSKIAFDSYDYGSGSRRSNIWIINMDGTNATKLVLPQPQGANPQWSPNGTRIACGAGNESAPWDIWVMNPDGTNATRLTELSGARMCSWNPDGSKLAFSPWRHLQSTDNNIVGNTVSGNGEVGIVISWDGRRNTVESNLVQDNAHGISLVQAPENVIINNTVTDNTYGSFQGQEGLGVGLSLDRSNSNILRNNRIVNNSANFLIGGNRIEDYVNDMDESNMVSERPMCYWINQSDRQVPTNAGCVLLVNCSGILAENLLAGEHNGFGVALCCTTNSTVRNVTASNSMFGIDLMMSDGNNIVNNTMSGNSNGLYLSNSGNNTLRNNVMESNMANFGVMATGPTVDLADMINDVDGSNTVNGKPVCYWVNQSDKSVPRDAGVVYLYNCSNIAVEDMSSSDNLFGVCLFMTNDCVLENVTVQRCVYSFVLLGSSNNVIKNSAASDGISSAGGILIMMGNNNTVAGSTISRMKTPANPRPPQEGPPPEGLGLLIMGNDTRVFHNNFLNNSISVLVSEGSSNFWDNGCEGNYWSNYNGSDLDADGVGDTGLPCEGVDVCPLMNVYWSPCDIDHDLRVDMKDIGKSAKAFNTKPGDAAWNQHVDITGLEQLVPDGKVDMRDISLIAKHFGEHYP